MNNIRCATLVLSLVSLGLGSSGCPAQTVCPTCGLRLERSESATLSLSRFGKHADDELLGTEVILVNRAGATERHAFSAAELPIPPGEVVTLTGVEYYWVGEQVTATAEVRMRYRDRETGNEVEEVASVGITGPNP